MSLWNAIEQDIAQALGCQFHDAQRYAQSGGCINHAYVLEAQGKRVFVKLNQATMLEMFVAEAEGLAEIIRSNTVRAPRPLCWGVHADQAYLVMEFLAFGSSRDGARTLGAQLAQMHDATQEQFGWQRDNTIGATSQVNTYSKNWIDFYRDKRLGHQLHLAANKGARQVLLDKGERLQADIESFFIDHRPLPALLHGDLWSGNYATTDNGQPVIFDPAVYYGDREADLAMTELFGGFPRDFYAAYQAHHPLDQGYRIRKTLYNLYHILNHFNLFGGGYASQTEHMLDELLGELRG